MKAYIKDNIALVAAIVLPLLLTAVFAISTLFVNTVVEDPKNDFLIATDYYPNNGGLEIDVIDDRLQVRALPVQRDSNGNPIRYGNEIRLWRVHVPEMSVEEISLKKPSGDAGGKVSVPALEGVTVRNITPGPDGYSYATAYSGGSGNFMTEIFAGGGRSYSSSIALSKNGRYVSVKMPDEGYSHYNTRFIGWIIEDEAQ